jgi:hypothetical protein
MRRVILKIKEGLAYLSLGPIYDFKEYSQTRFCENVPLILIYEAQRCALLTVTNAGLGYLSHLIASSGK